MKKDLTMEERFKLQTKLNDLPRDSSNIRVLVIDVKLLEELEVFIENLVFLELN